MGQGYISVWRTIFENPIWLEDKFTRGQAWIDLLLLANHEIGYIRKRGIRITINRGEIGRSQETLANRWQWSRKKVSQFLKELELDEMIEIVDKESKVLQKIKIINYDKYQQNEQQNIAKKNEDLKEKTNNRMHNKRTTKEQQKNTNNNNNKNNNKEKDTYVSKKELKDPFSQNFGLEISMESKDFSSNSKIAHLNKLNLKKIYSVIYDAWDLDKRGNKFQGKDNLLKNVDLNDLEICDKLKLAFEAYCYELKQSDRFVMRLDKWVTEWENWYLYANQNQIVITEGVW